MAATSALRERSMQVLNNSGHLLVPHSKRFPKKLAAELSLPLRDLWLCVPASRRVCPESAVQADESAPEWPELRELDARPSTPAELLPGALNAGGGTRTPIP